MGMVGKSGTWLHAEVIKHQEGAEIAQLWRADRSAHPGTSALGLLDGEERLPNGSWDRHVIRRGYCFLLLLLLFFFRNCLRFCYLGIDIAAFAAAVVDV